MSGIVVEIVNPPAIVVEPVADAEGSVPVVEIVVPGPQGPPAPEPDVPDLAALFQSELAR